MTKLTWSPPDRALYETGVSQAALFLDDGSVVSWSGVTSIKASAPAQSSESYYVDGIKYLDFQTSADFEASIEALSYPKDFEKCFGYLEPKTGFTLTHQKLSKFALAYKTLMGDKDYRIHLIYNCLVVPNKIDHDTIEQTTKISNYAWALKTSPIQIANVIPTAHVYIDTVRTPSDIVTAFENMVYGTNTTNPSLPSASALSAFQSSLLT